MSSEVELPDDPDDFDLAENAGPCPNCGSFDIDVDVGELVVEYDCNDCDADLTAPRYEFEAVQADLRQKLREKREEADE